MALHEASVSLSCSASISASADYTDPINPSNAVPTVVVSASGTSEAYLKFPHSSASWRLYITDNNGDPLYVELNELEFYDAAGVKIDTTGGSAIYSNQHHSAGSAFDDSYTSYWTTNSGSALPQYIGYSWPDVKEVHSFRITRQGTYRGADAVPTGFQMEYLDSGAVWVKAGATNYSSPWPYDNSAYRQDSFTIAWSDIGDIQASSDLLTTPEVTLSAIGAFGNVYNGDTEYDESDTALPAPLLTPEITLSGVVSEGKIEAMFPTLSAQGWTGNAGNGDLRGLTASVSATALFGKTFSGDLTAPFPGIESRYTLGEITALIASVDADAVFSHVWSGSIRPGAPTLSGEATFDTAAMTGRAQLLLPSLSASALIGIAGAGDIQIKKQLLSATGFTGKVFTGQLTAPMVTLSAGGDVVGIWTADIELPIVQVYATGEIAVSAARVFAINTKTTAVTEYTGFGFDSMVTFNGVVLGVNGDGLYAITGDSDDGTDIDAFLRTGTTDFGSSQLKRVSSAFVNYRTDGEMELQVTVDNDESYCYPLDGNAIDQIHTDEVKIGRGLDGRNWQFEFRNVLGADFELDAVEYDVTQLVRKLR